MALKLHLGVQCQGWTTLLLGRHKPSGSATGSASPDARARLGKESEGGRGRAPSEQCEESPGGRGWMAAARAGPGGRSCPALSRARGARDLHRLWRPALQALTATGNVFQGLCRLPGALPPSTALSPRAARPHRDRARQAPSRDQGRRLPRCLGPSWLPSQPAPGSPLPLQGPSTAAWVQGLSPAQGERGAVLLQPPKGPGCFFLNFLCISGTL